MMALMRYAKLGRCFAQCRLSSHASISFATNPAFFQRRCFARNVPVTSAHGGSSMGSSNIVTSQSSRLKLVEDKSFPAFLFEKFDNFGNKRAIIDGVSGREYSYSQIQELAFRCGSALTKLGFMKGDVLAIYCPNIPEYPIIYLAVMSLGGIVTTSSPLATLPELCNQMKHCNAKFIITIPLFASNAKQTAKQCGMKEVFVVGEAEGCRPLSFLFQDDGLSFPNNVRINPKEDVAVIPYSSGTTGLPKGVMLTHFNLSSNVQQVVDGKEYHICTPDDILLGILPFFHIFGMNVVQGIAFYSGAAVVSLPKFEEQMFLQTLEKFKVSQAHLVPPILLFLVKSPMVDNYDLTSLQDVVVGAAPMSHDLEMLVAERLKGVKNVRQGYGLTETSPVLTIVPVGKPKGGSAGTLIPNTEAKVVDVGTGEPLRENEKGEVLVRGPQIMKGYLNNPQATNDVLTSDGWFRTGDVGYYDSENFFYIVDRCKELIKYKGLQVAPAELEAVLIAHPKIQDAAVIGIPDEEAGELPKAFIVSASSITKEEVNSYLEGEVASYKKVRGGIEFVDEIPKSASGKILRRVLKDRERSK